MRREIRLGLLCFPLTIAISAGVLASTLSSPVGAAPAVAPSTVAEFTNPVVGSANNDMTGPFQWSQAPGAYEYFLAIGTSPGNGDVSNSFVPPSQNSLAVNGLPTGRTLWARIWTELPGQWLHGTDVTFSLQPSTVAEFTHPVVGSANHGMTGSFQWSQAPGAAEYFLAIGTSPGNGDVSDSFVPPSQNSLAVNGLPTGRTLWARIWTELSGQWLHGTDVTFSL
jgi:hypothetical protein